MNKRTLEQTLDSVVISILRPLVRILLRNGMAYGKFTELAKWVYVDIASRDFSLEGRKQSASRVSIITGLNRKEVARMQSITPFSDDEAVAEFNRAARVVAAWVRDFPDANGGVKTLSFAGKENSFSQLVKNYSGDMPARAVLDELIATGNVERDAEGNLILVKKGYVPRVSDTIKLTVLGQDVSDLVAAIDHNLQSTPERAYLQQSMFSNNVSNEAAELLRKDTKVQSQALFDYLNKQLAQVDRDVAPDVGGSGRKRVTLGMYFYEEDYVVAKVEPIKPKKKSPQNEPSEVSSD